MLNKNIETFIGCESDFKNSDIVIFGAPFDSTTSFRPGTRFASKAMRSESFGIETYSPYQDKILEDINVFDGGDLELCFGNSLKALNQIKEYTKIILENNKKSVMIGGEHLVSLGSVSAYFEKYPELQVIHFDAHADLRDDYLGEKLSHASVIRRIWELIGDNKIHQFGIRSGEKSEFEFALNHTNLVKFNLNGLDKTIEKLKNGNTPVYFSLDLDVLDPSEFCGTGTPEAGGINFNQLLEGIIKIGHLNIVGCDINELSPIYDQSGASTALACKILRELLLAI